MALPSIPRHGAACTRCPFVPVAPSPASWYRPGFAPVEGQAPNPPNAATAGQGDSVQLSTGERMLESAKRLISPSGRSDVPPFMVMDVMAAAARIEASGGRVIHMEVGQPAAPAPASAIAAAGAALAGPLRYTESLGIPSLRARIARHYQERYGVEVDPARIIV